MCELAKKVPFFFGCEMKYDVEFIDKIEPNSRGKYRFSICELQEKPR